MNGQKEWDKFYKSGTVRDYLAYIKAKRGE